LALAATVAKLRHHDERHAIGARVAVFGGERLE